MANRFQVAALVAALLLPLATGPAGAQTEPPSWLLKYLSFYSNVGSNVPNTQERTIIRLHGWYPYDCGGVRSATIVDQGHVRFTLRKASEICNDTTRTWTVDFDLGFLPLGDHVLNVERNFVAETGDSITESASFGFPVIDLDSLPPPPPPPPPPPVPHWLVPYVSGWYPIPAQPNALEPTTAVLEGSFPFDCGRITDVRVADSGHIEFTLAPGPACSDTVRRWEQPFNLGLLPQGYHVVHIKRSLSDGGVVEVAEGDFGFEVWADPNTPPTPPPPGPPNFPSVLVRCLSGWHTTAPPTAHSPTTLVLWGWFPYYCGQIVAASVLGPNHVSLTLRNKPNPCPGDTTVSWYQSFDLGMLAPGPNEIRITLIVEGDPEVSAVRQREATITLQVDDRDVTASVPNPFVSDTRFSVSSSGRDQVDVGIYDLNGRRVATLYRGILAPGSREFTWNGRRDDGSRAAIGIYFSRVAFSNRVVTRKLVMLPK